MQLVVGPRVGQIMPRDSERVPDGTRPAMAPGAAANTLPESHKADRSQARARSKMPTIPADPELLRFRSRLDQQIAAWREIRPDTDFATVTSAPTPRFDWRAPLAWITPIAACAAASFAGWWIASAPAIRAGEELVQVRQAMHEEQYKAEKLVVALAAASRELGAQAAALAAKDEGEQERDALRKALQQSEAAKATVAQSLAEERSRNQELERQLAIRSEAMPPPSPGPAADATADRPAAEPADPELLHLLARATLLVARGDIGGARVVLERAVETGSASALFALAETFDPAILSAWGTVGTQGDPAWARELYAKALAGGIAAAKDRLATLGR